MQAQPIVQKVQQPITQIYRQRLVMSITPSQKQPNIQQYLKIIAQVLQVDKELNLDQLKKTVSFNAQTSQITIEFGCIELKLLRACITGFLRHMHLVAKTIQSFRPQE